MKQKGFVNRILLMLGLDEIFFYYRNAYKQFWFLENLKEIGKENLFKYI